MIEVPIIFMAVFYCTTNWFHADVCSARLSKIQIKNNWNETLFGFDWQRQRPRQAELSDSNTGAIQAHDQPWPDTQISRQIGRWHTDTHIARVDGKGGTKAEKDRTRNNNRFYGTNCVIRRPTFFLLFFPSFDLLGRVLYTHDTVKGRPFGHRIHFWVKVKR